MEHLKYGVIVGIIKEMEWMLPWWWMNYRQHNDYPVTFITIDQVPNEYLDWVKERGTLLPLELPNEFEIRKDLVDPVLAKKWITFDCRFWVARVAWYKKPFSLKQSPYEKSIWIDLDCQVRGSLKPIFDSLDVADFTIMKESERSQQINRDKGNIVPGQVMYNGGIIGYKKGSKILDEWCDKILKENHLFFADQQMLAYLLSETEHPFNKLPPIYNWLVDEQFDSTTRILHFFGNWKQFVRDQMATLEENYYFKFPFKYERKFTYPDRTSS